MSIETLVIILNYCTADLTIQCLQSISNEIEPSLTRVVVVDNHSNDLSGEIIGNAIEKNGWNSWASLMALKENRGYAAGNNEAIRAALAWPEPPKYALILNPDTIVQKGAIRELVDFMEKHPKVGIAGSRLENLDGTHQNAAFRFPTIMSELDDALRLGIVGRFLTKWKVCHDIYNEPHRVNWVTGASFIIRIKVFDDVGLMDEAYFLYYEELDFCLQAHHAGWECWHVPQSRVVHLVGRSTGIDRRDLPPKRRPSYWFESRRRFFQKNYGWMYAAFTDITWIIGFSLWRIRRIIQQKNDNDPPYMLWDFFKHSSLINKRF
jgi:N-acetylglucosaminyl-diphospho-decaprenol L-rhamnosyltransferase